MDKIRIIWNGHSCFKIEADGHSIIIDPYHSYVPQYPELHLEAGAVFNSHEHKDHNCTDAVTLISEEGSSPFSIRTVSSFHDEEQGRERGTNKIHIIRWKDLTIAHLGDLGHALSPEQIREIGPLDAVMIPVGGRYTIDGKTAATMVKALAPTIVIPMHYRHGIYNFPDISTVDEFLHAIEGYPIEYRRISWTEIDKSMEKQVVILTYPESQE